MTTTSPQVQDLIDAFRSELDARVLAVRSKRIAKEALDAAMCMDQTVTALVEAGYDIDPDPLVKWTAELREITQSAPSPDRDRLTSLFVKIQAIQVLSELLSSDQLVQVHELLERAERHLRPQPRRRRSRAANATGLTGIDRRHLPFGIRVECTSCTEIVTGVRDAGTYDWDSVLHFAKDHNARRHGDDWAVLRANLRDALKALINSNEVRVSSYVLLKR
jgi:hypothetical protein